MLISLLDANTKQSLFQSCFSMREILDAFCQTCLLKGSFAKRLFMVQIVSVKDISKSTVVWLSYLPSLVVPYAQKDLYTQPPTITSSLRGYAAQARRPCQVKVNICHFRQLTMTKCFQYDMALYYKFPCTMKRNNSLFHQFSNALTTPTTITDSNTPSVPTHPNTWTPGSCQVQSLSYQHCAASQEHLAELGCECMSRNFVT